MNINLDRSTWTRVAFGDVVANINDYFDPGRDGTFPYVAGPHIHIREVIVASYGSTADENFPPTFKRKFRNGDVLLHSRGIEKLASADRAGVTGEKLFVLRSKDQGLLVQPFLVWLLLSPHAQAHMQENFTGSVNKFLNWKPLAAMQIDLPPLEEQKRIADLLWTVERHRLATQSVIAKFGEAREAWLHSLFTRAEATTGFVELDELIEAGRPICYGVLKPGPEFNAGRLIVDVKDYPAGRVRLESVRRCDPQIEAAFKRSRLREGDVLLSIRGTIGRVAVVPHELEGHNISRDSARLSGDPSKVMPGFLRLILESPDVQAAIRRTTTGLAVKGINVARIRTLAVPHWSLAQQQEAVQVNDRVERVADEARKALKALSTLQASFLSAAFGGS